MKEIQKLKATKKSLVKIQTRNTNKKYKQDKIEIKKYPEKCSTFSFSSFLCGKRPRQVSRQGTLIRTLIVYELRSGFRGQGKLISNRQFSSGFERSHIFFVGGHPVEIYMVYVVEFFENFFCGTFFIQNTEEVDCYA